LRGAVIEGNLREEFAIEAKGDPPISEK